MPSAAENAFVQKINAFVDSVRLKAADGLTIQEAGQIAYAFILLAVNLATELENAGSEKKQFVMQALGVLYDVLVPAIKLPFALQIFYPFVAKSLRQLFIDIGSGAIEAAYEWIKTKR